MTSNPTSIDRLLAETDWLQTLARQLVSDPENAQDLAQETALAGLLDGERMRGEARPWLTAVARHTRSRLTRKEQRQKRHEAHAAQKESSDSTLDTLAKFELHRSVVDAVHALAEPYRKIILLRFWEDLPPRKIAERLGKPVETVKTQLYRGLSMLRNTLDQEHKSRSAWASPLSLWLQPATTIGFSLSPKFILATAIILLGIVTVSLQSTWTENSAKAPSKFQSASINGATAPEVKRAPEAINDRKNIQSPLPNDSHVLVVDAAGTPIRDALVFSFPNKLSNRLTTGSSTRQSAKAWSAKQQELRRLITSPKPKDPDPYQWIKDQFEHKLTNNEGMAEINLHRAGSTLFAFTDSSDGSSRINPEQTTSVTLTLYPRRTKRIAVLGQDGTRLNGILVGYRSRQSVQHAAITRDGVAVIPLLSIESRLAIDPEAAKGEYAILLPLGPSGSSAIDLSTDDDRELVLTMPPTGDVHLHCLDKDGNKLAVDGKAKLIIEVPSDRANPGQFHGGSTEITQGRGSFPQVGIGFPFSLSITITGRETPIMIPCEGIKRSSRSLTIPVVIIEDHKALLRAAQDKRRADIANRILAKETADERQVIQTAFEKHDEWSINVIVIAQVSHGAFDRAISTLRRFQARQYEYYSARLHHRYQSSGVRQAYHNLAHHTPKDLIQEYNRQLSQSDLAEHRSFILTAIGFYANDKALSSPFILSVFQHDPDPRVRASSLLAIGVDADLETCEQIFLQAIADPLVLPHVTSKLSNFFNRAEQACVRRICTALLNAPGLNKQDRVRVEAILEKH